MSLLKQKLQQQRNQEKTETVNDAAMSLMEEMIGKRVAPTPPPVDIAVIPAPAIEQMDEGMRIGNFLITATGLEIADGTSQQEWLDFYKAVDRIQTSLSWVYGDYFAYGEIHFGMKYPEMADLTGLKAETIETYASVSRNVPKLIRINLLTFGHHRLVAKYDQDTQSKWLNQAVENQWSVADLRRAIKGVAKPIPKLPASEAKKTQMIFKRVMKAMRNNGRGLDLEEVRYLRKLLDEAERMARR